MAAAAPDSDEPPLLVIVPGLKGSHLKKRSCCGLLPSLCCGRIYVNFWRLITGAFCGCGDQMKLPRRYDADGRQLRDDLVPDGIVADVRICCGCIKLSTMYAPLVTVGETHTNQDVAVFSYDWRRSPAEAGDQLEAFIEAQLKKRRSKQGAQVVVHSNGALLSWPVLNRRPELFHSLLLIAPAFTGNVGFMPDVSTTGDENNAVAFNKSMQTPEHWLGWASHFFFLPLATQKMAEGRPQFAEADGTPVELDLHNLQHWKENLLGPYHPDSGVTVSADDERFMEQTLAQAREYRGRIRRDESVEYPPIGLLVSTCDDRTVTTWRRPSPGEPSRRRASMYSWLWETSDTRLGLRRAVHAGPVRICGFRPGFAAGDVGRRPNRGHEGRPSGRCAGALPRRIGCVALRGGDGSGEDCAALGPALRGGGAARESDARACC